MKALCGGTLAVGVVLFVVLSATNVLVVKNKMMASVRRIEN